ncbi:MAG: hypothetical protein IKB06_04980 [Clostridia bacterium]|nr:hypothetical protein [Clostridia bacterium]
MRILKFGGKSLSTPEKMQNICKYIKKIYKNEKNLIIVVSAIGKTTNELISLSKEFIGENQSEKDMAVLLSTGETISSALFSMMLQNMQIPTKTFQAFQLQITTFGPHTNSKIYYINKQPILDAFKNNLVCIVSGFQGINENNEITTLGRGGSDTTAAALGAVFSKDVEIYSDFSGVFAGDPRDFSFKKISRINHDSMISMANSGAGVIDSRATEIAKKFSFDIISKSSTKPNHSGSVICEIESDIISISSINNICQISIVFTNENKMEYITKNVISLIKTIKFYNLELNKNKISFLVSADEKMKAIKFLSEKLNLLSTKKT